MKLNGCDTVTTAGFLRGVMPNKAKYHRRTRCNGRERKVWTLLASSGQWQLTSSCIDHANLVVSAYIRAAQLNKMRPGHTICPSFQAQSQLKKISLVHDGYGESLLTHQIYSNHLQTQSIRTDRILNALKLEIDITGEVGRIQCL